MGGKELYLNLAYFSVKSGFYALQISFHAVNLHLKYILFNVQQ